MNPQTTILTPETPIFEAGSHKPFMLNGSTGAWYIEKGHLDLFAIRLENGEMASKRHHLARFVEGELAFGFPFVEDGIGILAVGGMGTRIAEIAPDWLQEASWHSERAAYLATQLDQWIERLAVGSFHWLQPKEYETLHLDTTKALQAGVILLDKEQTVWIRHEEGHSLVQGQKSFPSVSTEFYFPVSEHLWIETAEVVTVSAHTTSELLETADFWQQVAYFHATLLTCLQIQLKARIEAENERLHNKAVLAAESLASGTASLRGLLHKETRVLQVKSDNPLFTACKWVGEAMGLEMKEPPRTEQNVDKSRDQVREITQASKVRYRKVLLREDWWAQDAGPMLGLRKVEEDKPGHPVALIPQKNGQYMLQDATTGERLPVNKAMAQSIHHFAYSFYRPFAEKSLTTFDLIKFGAQSCKRDIVWVLLIGIAGGLLSMLTPMVNGMMFNSVIPEANRGQLVQVTAILIAIAITNALFQLTRSIAMMRIETKMDASIQAAMWDRLLNLPTTFFRKFSAGDLAMRVGAVSQIRQAISGATASSILSGIFSIFNFGLLFYYDYRLALWATLLTAIAISVTFLSAYLQLRHQRDVIFKQSKLSGHVLQFITGITKLRVAGAESKAFEKWARAFSEQRKLQDKMRVIGLGTNTFNAVFPVMSSMLIFSAIVLIHDTMTLSTGDFIAFNSALGSFTSSMLGLAGAYISVRMTVPMYEQAKPILEAIPEAMTSKSDPGILKGEIEVQHISFRYQENAPLVLHDVSIKAKPGEFVALVGGSGSGKSTMMRLLLGFEEAESGSLFFDGQDLSGLDIQAVRRQIGTVLQNGRLMSGDLFTNIIGSTSATLDDAWEAARMAGFDEDIKQMPMGMHTVVSEGGTTLSGGQRQRLMIARALVNRPRILFFDEATSALDNRTQRIVSESLERMQATRIVIAHRLSTIINADKIYVIDRGRVVQQGNYESLMQEEGLFKELATRQLT